MRSATPVTVKRDIVVCERWQLSFPNFYADTGPKPPGTSLDRINNDGIYEPGNCRYATRQQQMNNTRRKRRITWRGETLTQAQWARRTGISEHTLLGRLERGWTVERTLLTPVRKRPLISAKTLARWNRELGLSLLGRRLAKGWSLERAVVAPVEKAPLIYGQTMPHGPENWVCPTPPWQGG